MTNSKIKAGPILILSACVVGAAFLIYLGVTSLNPQGAPQDGSGAPHTLTWKDLQQLDYKSGKVPQTLQELHGRMIKVPGFVVPLDTNQKITDFLLVPNQAYCVHVPPPPPNLMIQVKMSQPIESQSHSGPVWLTGTLKIESSKNQFGEAGFQVSGTEIVPYQYEQR